MTPTLLLAAAALAAPPRIPDVDTALLKLYAETRGFLNGRPAKPKISPDGKTVFFLRSGPKSSKQSLFAFDVATKQTRELLGAAALLGGADENLSPEEKARRERQRVTAGGFADYHLDPAGKRVLVSLGGRLFVADAATGKAAELSGVAGAIDPKWSPDGSKIAYVRGYDVFVYDLEAKKESPVTTGGTAEKTHGLAEFVAQEEMHRHTGYWWSPDAKFLAYAEADHAGVEVWRIADPFKPDTKPAEQFYPRPGKKNVAVRLGIAPVGGGKTVWVEWPDRKTARSVSVRDFEGGQQAIRAGGTNEPVKYEYLARVAWGPKRLCLVVQTRDQREIGVAFVDLETGKSSVATSRGTTNAWFDLPSDPIPLDDDSFLMSASHINGEPEIVDHHESGMRGFGPADELLTLTKDKRFGFFTKRDEPTEQHVYRFDATDPNAKPTRLSRGDGNHAVSVSPAGDLVVMTSSTLSSLPVSSVRKVDGEDVGLLPSVALEPDFKPNVTVQKVGDYWTAVVRPRDFDPKKKYPVILDVYGGPRHLHVVQAMRNWLVPQWLADQGFVVVAADNRGTPGRGRDWERAVYKKFGTVPLDDQVKGLHALCDKFPELDRDRVGIVGWSFGGYMAANGVLRRPDVFKAAVAGAPVTDWEDYDTHYTERYLGLLPESRAAYDEASLLPLAKSLSRPLLLVHGTADDNVYFRHTLKLADALVRAGREFEVLPLPGVTHMVTADPVATERLWERTVRFFRKHLGEPR